MSITVSNFTQLRNAIVNRLDDYIYLTDDITFSSGGIQIPSATSSLTIDGRDPNTGIIHSITDYNSSSIYDTIYVLGRSTRLDVRVQNVNLLVRDYYGLVGIYDNSSSRDIHLYYENVVFNGTQMFYNRYSSCYIKDCDIVIDRFGSVCVIGELAEANEVVFEGTNTIEHYATGNSFIWCCNNNPKITIKEDSVNNITIHSREFCYADVDFPTILFESNSYFKINTERGMFYTSGYYHAAKTFTILDGAYVSITQTGSNGYCDTITCNSDLIVSNNATFNVFCLVSVSQGLIRMPNNRSIIFDNPKNVVLYKPSGPLINFVSGGSIIIDANQLNYWDVATSFASAGKIDDIPKYSYKKNDRSNVEATISYTTSSVSSITSNITSVDEGYPLNQSNFNMTNARVISLGVINYTLNEFTDMQDVIFGNVDLDSEVRLTTTEQVYYMFCVGGAYLFNLGRTYDVGTIMPIKFNNNFLHYNETIETKGSLTMVGSELIKYKTRSIPLIQGEIKRVSDFHITIRDSRIGGTDYDLYGYLASELHHETTIINHCVVFKDGTQEEYLEQTPILIYHGLANQQDITYTTLSYDDIHGLLLELDGQTLYEPGKYTSEIVWYLEAQ